MKKPDKNLEFFYSLRDQLRRLELTSWAIEQLREFKEKIVAAPVDDRGGYSESFEAIRKVWYDFLHDRLDQFDFVNGHPEENTWNKRPRACFIWELYKVSPEYWRPFHGHHCSSRERQEQMVNLLDDLMEALL